MLSLHSGDKYRNVFGLVVIKFAMSWRYFFLWFFGIIVINHYFVCYLSVLLSLMWQICKEKKKEIGQSYVYFGLESMLHESAKTLNSTSAPMYLYNIQS